MNNIYKAILFFFFVIFNIAIAKAATVTDYDEKNRQKCIDELKKEIGQVCSGDGKFSLPYPKTQAEQNNKFMGEMESKVMRICSYHCPDDIVEKCRIAVQSIKGGSGGKTYSGPTCTDVAKGLDALKTKSENDKEKEKQKTGPVQAGAAGTCNPYNDKGEWVVGKCPDMEGP